MLKAKSKGYGLEAWKALTEFYLKFPVRKITAGTMASNKGMIAICEKAGMKLESVKKIILFIEMNFKTYISFRDSMIKSK